jgi:hypothetical protein
MTLKEATPPILMSKRVYDGFRASRPDAIELHDGWLKPVQVEIRGYNEATYGMEAMYVPVPNSVVAA